MYRLDHPETPIPFGAVHSRGVVMVNSASPLADSTKLLSGTSNIICPSTWLELDFGQFLK